MDKALNFQRKTCAAKYSPYDMFFFGHVLIPTQGKCTSGTQAMKKFLYRTHEAPPNPGFKTAWHFLPPL